MSSNFTFNGSANQLQDNAEEEVVLGGENDNEDGSEYVEMALNGNNEAASKKTITLDEIMDGKSDGS